MNFFFGPDSDVIVSDPILLEGTNTFVGMDFEEGDEITFDIVFVEANKPDISCCMPNVVMPGIKGIVPLQRNCTRIKLTPCNPIVVIDYLCGYQVQLTRTMKGTTRVAVNHIRQNSGSEYLRGEPMLRTKESESA